MPMATVIRVNSWEECEQELLRIDEAHDSDPLKVWFRGQSDSRWELLSTLERRLPGVHSVESYYALMRRIKPEVETFTGAAVWDFPTYEEVIERTRNYDLFRQLLNSAYSYTVHLRHQGFPSPLLDWTRSPYVAAYFAFAPLIQNEHVSIYAFSEQPKRMKVTGSNKPSIFALGPIVRTHPRHFRQQSRYTVCVEFNGSRWAFGPHQTVFNFGESAQDLLWQIIIPASERLKVLSKLDRYNLNAFSLFASEESLMETFAFREIDLKARLAVNSETATDASR
jgi:hypothetical protein